MEKHYLKIVSKFNKGGNNVVASEELLDDQELIYIPTFEQKLLNFIEENERDNPIDLILISGTAGDGKTVFLSKFREIAGEKINGRKIVYNLDATHADKPNENQMNRLSKFFDNFSDDSIQNKPSEMKLIAINTGMLMNFFKNSRDLNKHHDWLEYFTLSNLNLPTKPEKPQKANPVWNIKFIDLSIRDIFYGKESIYEEIIENLHSKINLSEQCQECKLKNFCFLYNNLKILNENNYAKEQLQELFIKFEIESSTHITLRLFLETLSFLISGHFSDYSFETCKDEITELKKRFDEDGDLSLFNNLFYNRIFYLNSETEASLVDLKTLDFFKANKPLFISTKNWVNYMSYSYAGLVYELKRLTEFLHPLEEQYFKRFQKNISELEEELIGRENQNRKHIKSVMEKLRIQKNETFRFLIQRQYFFKDIQYQTEKRSSKDIKNLCYNEFRSFIKYISENSTKELNQLKNSVIRRICRALSLSDSYFDTLEKYQREQNEIIIQRKILRSNRIPSVSSLVRASVDPYESSIEISIEEEYHKLFSQLPLRIKLNLRINSSKSILIDLDFGTYFFLFKIANGYRPSTLDQRKYEEVELIKRKLLYLVSINENRLDLTAQDMCSLKIRSDESGSYFSWGLQC